jgi:hypothetical protein
MMVAAVTATALPTCQGPRYVLNTTSGTCECAWGYGLAPGAASGELLVLQRRHAWQRHMRTCTSSVAADCLAAGFCAWQHITCMIGM